MKNALKRILFISAVTILAIGCSNANKRSINDNETSVSKNIPVQKKKIISGEKLFRSKCIACHGIGEEAMNITGPHLNNLFGRKFGGVKNYRYSESLLKTNEDKLTCNKENLITFLVEPQQFIKEVTKDKNASTKMLYKSLEPQDIEKIVDYIADFNTVKMDDAHLVEMERKDERCFAKPIPNADFSECNLAGVDFSGADLRGANFKNANLIGAKLSKANLSKANLSGTLLAGADLKQTNFESANLTGAKMVKAFLANTNFKNATLDNVTWVNGRRCAPGSVGECE